MSFQESKYLASFLTILVVSARYAANVRDQWQAGTFDGPEGLAALGTSILWFIGTLIVVSILVQILVAILRGIFGGDLDSREDERDRLIEHRAMNLAFTTLSIAFVAALIGLVMGQTAVHAIFIILAGFIAAGLLADALRFALHRWGFRI